MLVLIYLGENDGNECKLNNPSKLKTQIYCDFLTTIFVKYYLFKIISFRIINFYKLVLKKDFFAMDYFTTYNFFYVKLHNYLRLISLFCVVFYGLTTTIIKIP